MVINQNLHIGGPLDGDRIERSPGIDTMEVALHHKASSRVNVHDLTLFDNKMTLRSERYHRETIYLDGEECTFWRHDSIPNRNMMFGYLMNRYRGRKQRLGRKAY